MTTLLAFALYPLDYPIALHLILFSVLTLSGIGFPVPEEVTLLMGGYLAYLEFVGFWPVVCTLIIGIIASDILGYSFGRYWGESISQRLRRFHTFSRVLEKGKYYFDRHGEKLVLFSRPFLGVRIVVPILAGNFRMNFGKFLLYDVVGAIPWTLFLVTLSYYVGSGVDLIAEVRGVKYVVLGLLVFVIVLYGVVQFVRKLLRT